MTDLHVEEALRGRDAREERQQEGQPLAPQSIGARPRADGAERYVVIEPIQGRVVFDHLLTFCFAPSALVRETRERDQQLTVLPAPAVRLMFDLRRGAPCSGGHARAAQALIMDPESLRRSAVQAEYAGYLGGGLAKALERFDRALALGRRRAP